MPKWIHCLSVVGKDSCFGACWLFSSVFALFAQIIMVVLICTNMISVSYTVGFIPVYAFLAMQCLPPFITFQDRETEELGNFFFDRVFMRFCVAWFVWGQFLCFFALVNAKLEGFSISGLAAFSPFLATAVVFVAAVAVMRHREGIFHAILTIGALAPLLIWIVLLALYVNKLWNPADTRWAPSLAVANIPLYLYMVPIFIGLIYAFNRQFDDGHGCCCPAVFQDFDHALNPRRNLIEVDFQTVARRIPE